MSTYMQLGTTESIQKSADQFQHGRLQTDLGINEYHKYRVALENARHEIRGEYERAKAHEANCRKDLFEKYTKLHKFVLEENKREEVEEAARQESKQKDQAVRAIQNITVALSQEEREKEREERRNYHQVLVADCETKRQEYLKAQSKVEQQNKSLASFLQEQGRTLTAVEQAEALNTKLKRSNQRLKAHQQIMLALSGEDPDDEDNGMSYKDDENQLLRGMHDANAKSELKAVEQELGRLRNLEEHTDQLVDRLKNKLDSINLLEESQVEMVDWQVRKHTQILGTVNSIEVKVQENNDSLKLLKDQMDYSINSELDKIEREREFKNTTAIAAYCILLAIACLVGYYLITQLGNSINPFA